MLAWRVLASILEPEGFLVYGAGVLVAVGVVMTIKSQMMAAAEIVRKKVTEATEARMQVLLRNLKENVEEKWRQEIVKDVIKKSEEQMGRGTKPVKQVVFPAKVDA